MKLHRLFTIVVLLMILFSAVTPVTPAVAAPSLLPYVELILEKTASAIEVPQGEPISFTLTIRNRGKVNATNVVLRDVLPNNPGLDWSIVEQVGSACEITDGVLVCTADIVSYGTHSITLTSPTGPGSCGLVSNTATVQATNEADAQLGNNSDSAEIQVTCPSAPVLQIEKTADVEEVIAGMPLGFTITVRNTGGGAASSVVIEDQLDAALEWSETTGADCAIDDENLLTCTIPSIPAGESASVHVEAATTRDACGVYSNTAGVRAGNHRLVTDVAEATVLCPAEPVLDIVKTADAEEVLAGAPVGFSITVRNIGGSAASNVVIEDALAPGLEWSETTGADCNFEGGLMTCTFASLAAGASAAVHVTALSTPAVCGEISNTASASADSVEPVTSTAAVTTITCPVLNPVLSITKTAEAASVNAGSPVGFTITVANSGDGAATNVVIEDQLDPDFTWSETSAECAISTGDLLTCTIPSLVAGASYSVHVTAPTNTELCQVISNVASVSAGNHGEITTGTITTTVNCPVLNPVLSITKTADAASVNAGSPVGFTITVANSGNGAATNVVIEDQLDADFTWSETSAECAISTGDLLTCTIPSLVAGASYSVHVTAPTNTELCQVISNTASVSAGNHAEITTGTVTTTVTCPVLNPVLSITKTADVASVNAGSPVGFTITVANSGYGAATNVVIEDQLDADFTWSETSAECAISTGDLLTCTIPSLAAGVTYSVHVTAPTNTELCQVISNTASVSAGNHGEITTGTVTTTVACPTTSNVTLSKLAEDTTVELGGLIQFNITVSNIGPAAAQNVTLTDTLPSGAGLSWSIAGSAPGCAIASGVLTCSFGTLNVNASRSVSISSTAGTGSCGTVSNTASVSAANEPSNLLYDNTDSASVQVPCPVGVNVKVSKTTPKPSINQGEPVFFTIVVTNDSTQTATGVRLTDPLPTLAGLSWSIVTPVTGCSITGTNLACDFGSLAAGATRTVSITSQTSAAAGEVRNTATVSATNESAGMQGDNQATASVQIPLAACLNMNIFNGVYNNSFENAQPGPIGFRNYKATTAPRGQKFLGEYSSETASITVGCLPPHTHLLVSFDLHIIRSWDGNHKEVGPDHWKFELLGRASPFIDTTFSNWSWEAYSRQSYPENYPAGDYPFQTGVNVINQLGYMFAEFEKDATYTIQVLVPHVGELATLNFTGYGLEPADNESWGLDNLVVTPTSQISQHFIPIYMAAPSE